MSSRPAQIVLDTCVIVSGLRSRRGASYQLLSLVGETSKFEINVSVPLVLEYEEAIRRDSHANRLTQHDVETVVDYLCSVANQHNVFFLWRPSLRDADDEMVLEVAVACQSETIVTFNTRDFAQAASQFGVKILRPAEFLREIGAIP